jgi:CRP-like cAMP-binding protein
VVAVIELCPFAPTLAGKLLATLAGKVDLQEHARAFLDRRLLSRVATRATFDGEASLVWTSLLSLAWLGWVVRLLFTRGAQTALRLLAAGLEETGPAQLVLYFGAAVLALALPLSLVALFAAVARALLALRPSAVADEGAAITGPGDAKLAEVPLFARLPEAERDAVARAGQRLSFPAGATLVAQGAQGDRFYALLDGQVSVHVEAESGLSRQVATLGAGDCFGEAALLGEGRRLATVKADTAVTVLALGREAFTRLQGQLQADQLASVLRNSAALKKSAFFGSLPAERLSSLAFQLTRRTVQAGQTLITRGEPGTECFLVSQGRFEVLGEGDAAVATLGPGDHFGEVALLRDVPRTATVRAAEEGVVLTLSRDEFLSAVVRDLGLSRQLERLAAERAGAAS